MRILHIIIIILISIINLYSQAVCYRDFNNTYQARDTFPTIQVADDFGPRDLSDDWHGGVDFNSGAGNSDFGDMLLAPEAGTFPDVNRLIRSSVRDIRYQVLDAGDHRYTLLHMFDKHQTQRWYNDSTIYINYCLSPDDTDWGMVILIDGDTLSIGQNNNNRILFRRDTITVSNSIAQYAPIGILGNSGQYKNDAGVWTDYVAHLHLNTVPDTYTTGGGDAVNSDPCQYIDYDSPDYEMTIWSQLSNNSVAIKYPGDESTKIAVRTQMDGEPLNANRYDHIMDVNTVELKLRSSIDTGYTRIKGIGEESIISLGARLGQPLINHKQNNNYPGNIHQWKRTGVNSNAYNSDTSGPNQKEPWDDYYFTDFLPRIHQNDPMDGDTTPTQIAHCPQDARYNDGRYDIYAEVTNVRDSTFQSDTLDFVLDNFKPFIQSIQVFFDDKLVYNMSWECVDNCEGMRPVQGNISDEELTYDDFENTMTVIVMASEPLAELNLDMVVYGVDVTPDAVSPVSVGEDGQKGWVFTTDLSDYVFRLPTGSLADIQLSFTGHDLHIDGQDPNELLDLSDYWFPEGEQEPDTSCVKIPTRQAMGWSVDFPSGTETAHHFSLPTPPFCPEDDHKKDGKYVINGDSTVIDNFLPFVKEVQIYAYQELLYDKWWECNDHDTGVYLVTSNSIVSEIDHELLREVGLRIVATTSELLPELTLEIPGVYEANAVAATPDSYDYTFEVSLVDDSTNGNGIFLDGLLQLKFSAEDVGGNQLLALLGFESNDSTDNVITIPERAGSGWANPDTIHQGIDSLHRIRIVCGGESPEKTLVTELKVIGGYNCFEVNANTQNSAGQSNSGSIEIEVSGGIGRLEYQWSNGETTQNIENLPPGEYHLTITDQLCCQQVFSFEVTDLCANTNITINNPQISYPSTCNSSDGEIWFRYGLPASGGASPYTLTWSNTTAATWQNSNLSSGTYFLTVTDAEGCTATTSYNLLSEGTPQVEVWATPGCAGMSNGTVEAFGYSSDGMGEMSYLWNTGQTTDMMTDLAAGSYTVTVTNIDNGCSTSASVNLEEYQQQSPLSVSADVSETTCLQPTGSIDLTVTGGVFPYSFLWRSEGGFFSATDDLEDLPPGKYCVKVTDYCGMVVEDCFVVEDCKWDVEIVPISINHCTSYTIHGYDDEAEVEIEETFYNDDGSINIQVLGATEGYQIYWSNDSIGSNISNLSAGEYVVSVINDSGCCASSSFTVEQCDEEDQSEDFALVLQGGFVPAGATEITLEAWLSYGGALTDQIPSEAYMKWNFNGEYFAGVGNQLTLDIEGVELDENTSVSCQIWLGCQYAYKSIHLFQCDSELGSWVVSDFYNPCVGFADGSITLVNPFPTNDVDVTVNGLPFSFTEVGSSSGLTIGGLTADTTLNIQYNYMDCEFTFPFQLETQSPNLRLRYHDDNTCTFEKYCGETDLGVVYFDTYEDASRYSENTSVFNCKTALVCNNQVVGTKRLARRSLRGADFRLFLNSLMYSNHPSADWVEQNLSKTKIGLGDNACATYWFCPSKPQSYWKKGGDLVFVYPYENGCSLFTCLGSPSFTSCLDGSTYAEIFSAFGPEFETPIDPCHIRKVKLGVLLYYYENGYFDDNNAFNSGTSVNSLQFLLSTASDSELCNDISYCTTDYTVVAIDEINCGTYTTSGDCWVGTETLLGEEYQTLSCEIPPPPCCPNGVGFSETITFGGSFGLDGLVEDNTPDGCILETFEGSMEQEYLEDIFGIIVEPGKVIPKGIVKTPTKTYMYDYAADRGPVHKFETENVTHVLDNLEKDETIYIDEVMEKKQYNLVFSDTLSYWQMAIESSEQLTIDHLSREETFIEIGGTVVGGLQYNGSLLFQADMPSAFDIKIGVDGQVLSQKTIENIDPDEKVIFSKNSTQEMLIIGRFAGESLEVDGTTVGFNEANGGFIGTINSNNNVNVLTALSGSESMEILHAKYQATGGITTVFKTNDAIPVKLDDNLIIAQEENEIVILSLNPDGTFKWSQSFDANRVDAEKMAISYDADDNLLLGLTFTGGFYFQGEQFVSQGGKDIALLKLAEATGDLEWFETYGSVDDENVSQMFFTEGVLVFGGELSFSQRTRGELRSIGASCFYNTTNSTQKAYMTYAELPKRVKSGKKEKAFVQGPNLPKQNSIDWTVYPNPFGHTINVKVRGEIEENAELELYDIFGRKVLSFMQPLYNGENSFNFNIDRSLVSGVYFLRIKKNNASAIWKLNHFQ